MNDNNHTGASLRLGDPCRFAYFMFDDLKREIWKFFSTPTCKRNSRSERCNKAATSMRTVQDVVARYFEEEDRFVEAVKRGEAAIERGEFLTHKQMGDRLRRFYSPDGSSLVLPAAA